MKYEKFTRYILSFYFVFSVGATSAADYLTIHQDVTGDGVADQIVVNGDDSEFYTLSITSKGKEILKNKNLILRTIKNSGGLDIFQGVSVTDKNISIRYRFCSPSKGVCYDRNIVSSFKEGHFFFSREEATANADKIAVSGVFYQRPPTPLESLSYQSLLENNDNAEKLFSNIYGSCVAYQGGDSLTKISEALEKDNPDEWVLAKGCVNPALVYSLEAQEYLSHSAASKYLSSYK
ncbi:hypothetical protein [Pseudomonas cichorii]|uniref:hypothetical protein n=1 Tax=Pseudomonas cichorii TaxID=36746 RepID=UPI001C893842|nr:hypothetical protein [Pseudomonas cichorii]MBX8574469.1 hypothetical protein [Pseudomonas cichorii]